MAHDGSVQPDAATDEGARGHDGNDVPPGAVFFGGPDAAIGGVTSRASAARGTRSALGSLFARPACSYVGRDGVARYVLGFRGKVTSEVVRFADVTELRVTRDLPRPGSRARGRASWAFFTDGKEPALSIDATPRDGELAAPGDAYWLGVAAERAYSEHVVGRYEEELRAHGHIRFAVSARDVVHVGPGFLELVSKGTRARFDATEVRTVEVLRGHVVIKTGEAGAAAMGIYRMRIEDARAVHALAVVLQELAGVRMG